MDVSETTILHVAYLLNRNCLVGPNYTVKVSNMSLSKSVYSADYFDFEGRPSLPIRWMSWESILLVKKTSIGCNNNNNNNINDDETYWSLYYKYYFNVATRVFSYTEQIHTEERRLVVCRHVVGNTDVRPRAAVRRAQRSTRHRQRHQAVPERRQFCEFYSSVLFMKFYHNKQKP